MLVKNQTINITRIGGNSRTQMLSCSRLSLFMILIMILFGCGSPPGDDAPITTSPPSSGLVAPSVSVVAVNSGISLNWNDSNANQYRVLYWQGNNAPQEHITTSTTYTTPPLSIGIYTVIIEAYDELGNSLFSAPVILEVL